MQTCSKRSTVINPAADRDRRVGVSCVAAQDQWYLGRTRPWHEQRRVRNQPSPSATDWPASESQAFGVATNECSTGVRRWATEVVTGSRSSWLYRKTGSGNSCNIDSGGPDLVQPDADDATAPEVLALTGQGSCSWDQDYRVTSATVRLFVNNP